MRMWVTECLKPALEVNRQIEEENGGTKGGEGEAIDKKEGVEKLGVEPSTSCRNMFDAKHALYQMSYIPMRDLDVRCQRWRN
jgi:hypothetical protein